MFWNKKLKERITSLERYLGLIYAEDPDWSEHVPGDYKHGLIKILKEIQEERIDKAK